MAEARTYLILTYWDYRRATIEPHKLEAWSLRLPLIILLHFFYILDYRLAKRLTITLTVNGFLSLRCGASQCGTKTLNLCQFKSFLLSKNQDPHAPFSQYNAI